MDFMQRIYRKDEVAPAATEWVDCMLEVSNAKDALSKVFVAGKIIEAASARLRPLAQSTLGTDKEVINGVELGTRNLPAVWEYGGCNDPLYTQLCEERNSLQETLEGVQARIKDRCKFLQGMSEPMAIVATGEMIYPAVLLEQGSTIVVQFPKE
jgi:hypothetical protein